MPKFEHFGLLKHAILFSSLVKAMCVGPHWSQEMFEYTRELHSLLSKRINGLVLWVHFYNTREYTLPASFPFTTVFNFHSCCYLLSVPDLNMQETQEFFYLLVHGGDLDSDVTAHLMHSPHDLSGAVHAKLAEYQDLLPFDGRCS